MGEEEEREVDAEAHWIKSGGFGSSSPGPNSLSSCPNTTWHTLAIMAATMVLVFILHRPLPKPLHC